MHNTDKLITIGRLEILLDCYGAAGDRWPEEERAAAAALIETSSEARGLVEKAAALDSVLDAMPAPEVSAALTSRVRSMASPASRAGSGGMVARLAAFLRPDTRFGWQGAVAMAGVLGMVAGIGVSPLVFDRADPAPAIVAVAPPVTTVVATAATDPVYTGTGSLSPNVNSISLTGDDMSDIGIDETDSQTDTGEITVASVPLY